MNDILNEVVTFCKAGDLPFEIVAEDVLKLSIKGTHGRLTTIVGAVELHRAVTVKTVLPISIPEDRRLQMSEMLCRINFLSPLGAFQLDFADGEIGYETSIFFEDQLPHKSQLRHLLWYNWYASDMYLPAIASVAFGQVSPQEALSELLPDQFGQQPDGDDSCTTPNVRVRRPRRLFDGSNN